MSPGLLDGAVSLASVRGTQDVLSRNLPESERSETALALRAKIEAERPRISRAELMARCGATQNGGAWQATAGVQRMRMIRNV